MTIIITPESVLAELATKARARRLALQLTQEGLATRSGVSLGTLKKFERTGQISLRSLLKIALVLDALDEFRTLFSEQPESYRSLDELLSTDKKRQRGTIK